MITAEQIKPLLGSAIDVAETDSLKSRLTALRRSRSPFHLTAAEFEEILEWKLTHQIERQREYRRQNNDAVICSVTALALTITHSDPDYQLELRVSILCALRGVGVPVASAVLALCFPDEYAVIDFRNWRQLFETERNSFDISAYKRYMREVRRLSGELGRSVQEVDHAIWEFDRRNGC